MLARKLDDLDGIPHDVVLTHRLQPKCLHTERPSSDLRIPDEETWGERFAVDFDSAIALSVVLLAVSAAVLVSVKLATRNAPRSA